jgi:hypothetical protein
VRSVTNGERQRQVKSLRQTSNSQTAWPITRHVPSSRHHSRSLLPCHPPLLRTPLLCKNKWARIEALQRNKAFIEQYRDARAEKIAGRDIVFPAGTWWFTVLPA